MKNVGEADDILVRARSALLDVLDALRDHRDAVVVIGAQAVYLRTGRAVVAVAEATKDSDLAIDPRLLDDDPLLEDAMVQSGFSRDLVTNQPGAWLNAQSIPCDLMVPERLAGGGGKRARGARIPPHHRHAARRARGLEAVVVDNSMLTVGSLDPRDERRYEVRVAGCAALLVAKAHKIGERVDQNPRRLVDKDAHDIYRILVATPTNELVATFRVLLGDQVAGDATEEALEFLRVHFASGPSAIGSVMAGRTEEGIGAPDTVALQTSILASDLVAARR